LKERGVQETALPTMVRKLTITGPYELRLEPKGNIEDNIWRFELEWNWGADSWI